MARRRPKQTEVSHAARQKPEVLTVEEGRRQLHALARKFGELEDASESLTERAVEVVRQQTGELGGIARINDSGVRILHAARSLRKVAVGK